MKIVVFCPNLIGDTVMATPAFRALRHGFADATILGVIKPHVAPTVEGAPWFDEIIPFDPKASHRNHRTLPVVRRLRAERPDLAVLFPNSHRSAWMAWISGARRRIGFEKGGRGFLLTDRLEWDRDSKGRRVPAPIVESYLDIVRALGCKVDSLRTELFTTSADEAAADAALARLGLRADEPIITL
ncbi:glycosyltransferase family 9 protein, partial [Singulisphaera rosea]